MQCSLTHLVFGRKQPTKFRKVVIDHSKYSDSAIAALVFGHMMNIVEDFERFFLIKIQ